MTESDILNYLLNISPELKDTYSIYQDLLSALQNNDYAAFIKVLNHNYKHLSSYMLTSVNTLIEFTPYIKNFLLFKYNNGFIEGNNNFIKVIKRIAFGFRSFRRFKARIMICKGLFFIKKEAVF